MKRLLFTLLIACTVVACERWQTPEFEEQTTLPNVTIGDLKAYYGGAAELTITDDIVISGRVVSSDRAGNFYNTFFIDDGTGAVEIMAGMPDLDATYHPRQRISVRARGLAVGWRDGVMQMGLPPEPGNRFPTGYFYHPAVIRLWVTPEANMEPVEPIETTIANLTAKLPDGRSYGEQLCGRLVRIRGLRVDTLSAAETWAVSMPVPTVGYVKLRATGAASERSVRDPHAMPADSITVVTSGYASFADAPVPRGELTLVGILLYGKGESSRDHYLLKLRYEEDIDF